MGWLAKAGIAAGIAVVAGAGVLGALDSVGFHHQQAKAKEATSTNAVTATISNNTAPMQTTQAYNTPAQTAPRPVVQPPASPADLQLTSVQYNAVSLSWQAVKGNVHYDIYRSMSNYYAKAHKIAQTSDTSFTDHSVYSSGMYFYWVVAVNSAGQSTPRQVARAVTPYSWQTIRRANENAVVKIMTYTSNLGALTPSKTAFGSGFFVDGGKYILTCAHVVRNEHYVLDVFPYLNGKNYNDNTWYHAKVVKVDKAHDLALIQIYQVGGGNAIKGHWNAPSVQLGAGVTKGESLGILGHPGGQALTMTTGTVAAPSVTEHVGGEPLLHNQIKMHVPAVGGNSGSPVFNQQGRVVGVQESAALGDGNISYAVPITATKIWGFIGHNELTSKVEKVN